MTLPESPSVILDDSTVRRALPTDTPNDPPQQIPAVVMELHVRTRQNQQEPQPIYVIATLDVAEDLARQLHEGIEDCRTYLRQQGC